VVPSRLYLIADSARLTRRDLETAVREAVAAGVRLVQLREKHLDDASYRRLAVRLLRIVRDAGARLLLNGRISLVRELGAEGVHLPASGSVREARRLLGEDVLCVASVHNADELRRASDEGADFVTLSPVFETTSKPGVRALGLEQFASLVSGSSVPVYALGGVTVERVSFCLEAGVAVVNGVLNAPDVGKAVAGYFHALRCAL